MRHAEPSDRGGPVHSTDTSAPARYEPSTPLRDARTSGATRELGDVRIEHVELERRPSGIAVVRACVFLGTMLPPDARVDLLYESAPGAPPCTTCERMWSARPYENGWFLYEAHVPDVEIATARDIRVRVRPADGTPLGDQLGKPIAPSLEVELAPPSSSAPPDRV